MSSSESVAHRGDAIVALPVFPSRVFRHSTSSINRKSGIKTPKDLEGKRVGMPLYTQTAAIFIRGLLQHDYGVDLSQDPLGAGRDQPARPHGNPGAPLLKPVEIETNNSGKSLSDLLAGARSTPSSARACRRVSSTNPDIQRLFPNYREVEKDIYRRTIFPIMHLIAIRARRLREAIRSSRRACTMRSAKSRTCALARCAIPARCATCCRG